MDRQSIPCYKRSCFVRTVSSSPSPCLLSIFMHSPGPKALRTVSEVTRVHLKENAVSWLHHQFGSTHLPKRGRLAHIEGWSARDCDCREQMNDDRLSGHLQWLRAVYTRDAAHGSRTDVLANLRTGFKCTMHTVVRSFSVLIKRLFCVRRTR